MEARTAVDLFTGTTRVAQALKRSGIHVVANDIAAYSNVLADCYIATDRDSVDMDSLRTAIQALNELEGTRGYFTTTYCEEARFFQPHNGRRVDAIRDAIERDYAGTQLYPILLTSLMLAADRVDSTTGIQMAYLKEWAPRSYNPLELRVPELLSGSGGAMCIDAADSSAALPAAELYYLDPPYNQHRYFTNYHIWETLIRWDAPESYGVARKRIDARSETTKSVFNKKREMPTAFLGLLERIPAEMLIVSYNDESWISAERMITGLRDAGYSDVRLLEFDSKRYVGAQIGIYSPGGEKVGTVKKLRNTEYVFVAGPTDRVEAATASVTAPATS